MLLYLDIAVSSLNFLVWVCTNYVNMLVNFTGNVSCFLQVHPEGKFVVDLDKNIEMTEVQSNCRVALRNDSYKLHKILPNKVRGQIMLSHKTTNTVNLEILPEKIFSVLEVTDNC